VLASHLSLNWLLTWQTNKVNYSLFQILERGHSMVEYEIRKALYAFIGVLKNPKMHWLDTLGWIMVELMYA